MDCWQSSTMRICSAWVFLLVLDLKFYVIDSTSQAEVNKHLEMGTQLLKSRNLQDALSHYNAALEGDPNNYQAYFKRGAVYLALGKSKFALIDLDKVLQLKPDFTAARLQRGIAHLKQAQLEEAAADFHTVVAMEPHNEEAYRFLIQVEPVQQDIALAKAYVRGQDYSAAIELITRVIEVCPWSSSLRELRADCHIAVGDVMAAISDVRTTTKLLSDNTGGFLRLSMLYYQLGETAESLKEVRECLKLDPEHKDCFPHYKKVKKVDKLVRDAAAAVGASNYEACVDAASMLLKAEPKEPMVVFLAEEKLCHCHLHLDQITLCLGSCKEALDILKEPRILCDRAEAYINTEMFDDAIRDYQAALEMDKSFARANEGLQRAHKLQKQSERRDYYKILGVTRTANKREIVKAYRKAAQKWHPDNFRGEEKKIAEKRFIDIAAAKEVLTNTEKREQFDRGEDPLDPEAQGQQGFNPFQHHHFHGSPFQFKFHFN